MWQGWINLFVAGWLIGCAFLETIGNEVSMILAGIVFIVSGLWGAGRGNSWQDMVIAFIGVLLFLFVSIGEVNNIVFLISGIIALVIVIWDLIAHPHPG